jgi:hypothetical protein
MACHTRRHGVLARKCVGHFTLVLSQPATIHQEIGKYAALISKKSGSRLNPCLAEAVAGRCRVRMDAVSAPLARYRSLLRFSSDSQPPVGPFHLARSCRSLSSPARAVVGLPPGADETPSRRAPLGSGASRRRGAARFRSPWRPLADQPRVGVQNAQRSGRPFLPQIVGLVRLPGELQAGVRKSTT